MARCRRIRICRILPAEPSAIIKSVNLRVECHASRKADERPTRFWLHGKPYVVEAILDQWYEPESIFFKVRADDGNFHILRVRTANEDGEWDLVSFRQNKERER